MTGAVVIGASAGGINAIKTILLRLPKEFPHPIIIVQHISADSENYIVEHLDKICSIKVREAEDKMLPFPGVAYFAPPNYHLLIEKTGEFTLTTDEKVNFARPSIDVLFETAADVYGSELTGIILTGANNDGAHGLKCIKEHGGFTVVQEPKTAEVSTMPVHAIKTSKIDLILSIDQIIEFLLLKG